MDFTWANRRNRAARWPRPMSCLLVLTLVPSAHAQAAAATAPAVSMASPPQPPESSSSCPTPCCTGSLCGFSSCHHAHGGPTVIDPTVEGILCNGGSTPDSGWACCAMGTNAGQLCSSPQACGYTCPEYHAKPPLPDGCYNFKTGNGQVEGNGFPTNYGNEAPASTTIIDLGDGGKTAKVFVLFWQGGAASKDPQDPYTTCSVRYTAAITYEQAPPLSEQGYVGGNHSADGECGTVLVWTADKSTLKKSGDLDLCSSFEPPVWDDPHGDDDAGFPWKPYGNKTYAATGYVAVWFGNERGDGPLHVDGPFFESTSDCSGSNLLCEGHIFSTTCFLGQPNGWLFPMLIVGILLAVLYWVFKCRKACKAALAQVRHTASRSCPRSRSPPSLLATPPIRRRLAPSLPPSLPSSLSPLDSPTAREPSSAPGAATRRPSLRQAATRRRLRLQPTHRPARNGRVPSSAAASRAGRRTQPHVRSTACIGTTCRRRHLDNTDINSMPAMRPASTCVARARWDP